MRIATELAEVGSAHAADLLAAMGTDEFAADVPLAYVITAVGLADRYPLISGTMSRRLVGGGDLIVACHPLALAPACRRAAHRLMQKSW